MKQCRTCKEIKSLSEFHKHHRRKDGHANECKSCVKKRQQKWYKETREERLIQRKEYYDENREKILAQKRLPEIHLRNLAVGREWYQNHPEKMKATSKLNYAIKKGIITRPEVCENCKQKPDKTLHGHHEDYNKPLEVIWLCHACHIAYHGLKKRDIESSKQLTK